MRLRKMTRHSSALALMVGAAALAAASASPEQVHLAVGLTPSTMGVQWATLDNTSALETMVQWSLSPFGAAITDADMFNATGEAYKYSADAGRTWYNHVANMTDLAPATRYYYRVGGPSSGWSQVFHFKSQVTPEVLAANLPQHHIVFGDMGAACAFTICPGCTCNLTCDATTCADNKTAGLVAEVGTATHVVHMGDFAYNLADNGGTVGD